MPITIKPIDRQGMSASDPTLPLFIFLPGMDGTGELLRPQLAGLTGSFDVRCLSIPADDLTGWDGLVGQVGHLISQLQQRFSSRPIYLCGESFGGCLALQVAAFFPHLCQRLILVNPATSAVHQPWIGWGAAVTKWLPDSLYHISAVGLLPLLIAPQRVSASNRKALLRAMQSVTPSSAAWRLSMLADFLLEKLPLQRILQPVLILASGADRLLPSVAEAQRLVRALPNTQTVKLPDSGHACLLESDVRLGRILQSQAFVPPARALAVGSAS
ncbi:MAG: alpha/beta hydrolase [Synechococcaceae cyanobacterium]